MVQRKQNEWSYQWNQYSDSEEWLFKDWIYPNVLEDFRNKTVIDLGCGSGQHIGFVAPYAKKVVGVDLNTADIARKNTLSFSNVEVVEADIAEFTYPELFDIAYCIGVIHHTDNPTRTFENIKKLVKPGGRIIIWCYSWERNFLNRTFVELIKRWIISRMSRKLVSMFSKLITLAIYPVVYSLYLFPFKFLPYYEYFKNFRKLSFKRNHLNVFDKLNAPVTHFIKKETILRWFSPECFTDVYLDNYKGVSWRVSGNLKS